jgi:hypothetical protein
MRILSGFSLALLVATGLFAQNQSGFINPIPVTRSFGSVVNPGGGSSLPGVTRTTGSVLHPGGGSSQIAIPGTRLQNAPASRGPRMNGGGGGVYAYPVAVPVYVGDSGASYLSGAPVQAAPAQSSQPNVIVVYPPAPQYAYPAPQQPAYAEVPSEQLQAREEQAEPSHYLLAFKDRSIYSAVAYWVDGDTIHYFTSGNTHNQASLSLIDRDMTKRLNEGGLEVRLPAEK